MATHAPHAQEESTGLHKMTPIRNAPLLLGLVGFLFQRHCLWSGYTVSTERKKNCIPLGNFIRLFPQLTIALTLGGGKLKTKKVLYFTTAEIIFCQNLFKIKSVFSLYVQGSYRSRDIMRHTNLTL